jgi:GNAT superfamily N-acetyltransferase
MMTKNQDYRQALLGQKDWDSYLMGASGLPGPRGNIELAQVAADEASREQIAHWLTINAPVAPVNSPAEFLCFCGVVGLGRLIAQGETGLLKQLRIYASDSRWRTREGVAMALQRLGRVNMPGLIDEMEAWGAGSWLEMRAAAAALAEPALLDSPEDVRHVLALLDRITGAVERAADRKAEDFRTLRQGLGYCWSVVVAALPDEGKVLMEKWFYSPDPDVIWIMKENLKKKRLQRMDGAWFERWNAGMPTPIKIRLAEVSDALTLARLNQSYNGVVELPEHLADRLGDVRKVDSPILAEAGGHAVGFACLRLLACVFYAAPYAELTELYVEPGWRRKGVARALMAFAEDLARRSGAVELMLLTGPGNHAAQALYRCLEYIPDGLGMVKAFRKNG